MTDTIGRCECINYSDKFDLDQLLSKEINELDDRLIKIRKDRKELIELGAKPDELSKKYDAQKSKLKNLLSKIRNTPDCK